MEKQLAEKIAKRERIFHLGFKNQAEVRDFYHAADLLFVPSEYETWGLVVNEAFACGLPALVTDTCGVAGDLVIPNETGFVFPMGKVDVAAALVKRLLSSKEDHAKLSRNAVEKIQSQYHVDQFADSILEAFGKAIRIVS